MIGSANADAITVSQASGTISVVDSGRLLKQVSVTSVTKIVVDAGFGNDSVAIGAGIAKPTFLYGGYGNDVLRGGGGIDQIYGGAGDDRLYGNAGNDVIYGGSGNDTLDGGLGTNTVIEGAPARTRQMTSLELEVVNLVNQERTSRGLKALTINPTLAFAAGFHSNQMVARANAMPSNPAGAMQHTLYGVNAPTPTSRLDYSGYDNWMAYGENIAYGYTTAAAVMQAWMNSSGHRANILNPNFTEIGVGVATSAAGYLYWTQEFGTR